VPLLDYAGRRPLLLYPAIVMIIDLLVMTISLVLQVSQTVRLIDQLNALCISKQATFSDLQI
jgi:hypothetical protein